MEPPAARSSTSSPEVASLLTSRRAGGGSRGRLRGILVALAISTSLLCSPLAAQEAPPATPLPDPALTEQEAPPAPPPPEPTLEELIPNEAVANPEAWAQQGVPPDEAAAAEQAAVELQPDSPLAEVPQIDIPWPEQVELPQIAPLEPEEGIEFADFEEQLPQVEMGAEERISDELVLVFPSERALFPHHDEFIDRFRALSTIEQLDDDDNAARLAAQARADEELLHRMLRVYGYFDALVYRSIGAIEPGEERAAQGADAGRPTVRFEIIPGIQYRFGAIDLGNLVAAGPDYPMLRGSFQIQTGDPLLQDKIVEERYDLDRTLGETGYAFAAIAEPDLLVDHARDEGDLTMPVTPGGKYNFGAVNSNLPDFLSSEHLADIARFEPGELYQRSLELDLRRAILATGLVGTVTLTPREVAPPTSAGPGTVDIDVAMTQAKLRTIAGAIGYGTGEGFKVQGSWEHRNLFPPEGMLRVRGVLGTEEQLFGVTFRKNNFGGRDKILTVDAFASTIDYDAYDARTLSLVGTFERVSTLLFQKPFSYSAGLELVATEERERDAEGNAGPPQTFFIAAVPLYAQVDTSDDLLDPTEGFRLGLRASPEISRTDGVESVYVRGQLDASYYLRASEKIVLAARARLGSIPGAPVEAIAPSRRLYAGGGGSVRGYAYRGIGPHNSEGDPSGGRSLVELSAEARIRTGMFGGALGVVPFVDAGTVGEDPRPSFDEIKVGAGIGLRYYTGFGPLRLDVAIPLNPGPNDPDIGVYVALGHSF